MQPIYLKQNGFAGSLFSAQGLFCHFINLLYSPEEKAGDFFYERRVILADKEKLIWAVEQLQQKYIFLGRLPKKSDFDEVTRARIKSLLGPWPRALETAGLKEKKIKKKGSLK